MSHSIDIYFYYEMKDDNKLKFNWSLAFESITHHQERKNQLV